MEWLKTCANCKHFRKAWAWCAKKKQTREENWDACDKQENKEPFVSSNRKNTINNKCKAIAKEIKTYNYNDCKKA